MTPNPRQARSNAQYVLFWATKKEVGDRTFDLPVPVAPITAIRGSMGAFRITGVKRKRFSRRFNIEKDDFESSCNLLDINLVVRE